MAISLEAEKVAIVFSISNTLAMPKFSIIIACVNGLPSIAECLTALEKSQHGPDVEIIVIDSTDQKTKKYIEQNFPRVKLIKLTKRVGIPEMRAIGMNEATGNFLVVIEDHCIAPEGWFDEIGKAHHAGYPVVGGAVENASTDGLVNWAAFLCEYSAFMSPVPSGEVDFLPGNNISYHRSVIEQLDKSLINDFWEYFIHANLKERNVKFFCSPLITVDHKKDFGFFYFLSQRFHYSRSFSAMRRTRSTYLQKLVYLAYTPFLPFHLSWRIINNVLQKRRHRKELILSFPVLAVFLLSYALGELTGQLFGSGNSLLKVE